MTILETNNQLSTLRGEINQVSRENLQILIETHEMLDRLDFDQMIKFILFQIRKALKIERCSIFRVFSNFEKMKLMFGLPEDKHGLGMVFKVADLGLSQVIQDGQYLLINNPGNDPRMKHAQELIYHNQINAILFIPIAVDQEVKGIIVIDSNGLKKGFSREEVFFCRHLGNQVSLLLERDILQKKKNEKENLDTMIKSAAQVAHLLRNPVVSVGGFIRVLAKRAQGSVAKDHPKMKKSINMLATALREINRVESIVNDILILNKHFLRVITPIEINQLLLEAKENILSQTSGKQIDFILELDQQIGLSLFDRKDILHIFLRILKNAVEAISEKGKILIKTSRNNNHIRICIANDGGCINKSDLNKIKNPFYSDKINGAGLGLAIAAKIINHYNGDLDIENDQEANQVAFIVKLPLN